MIVYDYSEHVNHDPTGCDYRRIGLLVDLYNMFDDTARLDYLKATYSPQQLLSVGYVLHLDAIMLGVMQIRCAELGIPAEFIHEMSELIRVHLYETMKELRIYNGIDRAQLN